MNLNPYKISEQFITNKLKLIMNGNLNLVNYDNTQKNFGDLQSNLKADIKVNNSKSDNSFNKC